MLTHSQITRGTKSLGEEEYYKWKRRKRKVQKWMSQKKHFGKLKTALAYIFSVYTCSLTQFFILHRLATILNTSNCLNKSLTTQYPKLYSGRRLQNWTLNQKKNHNYILPNVFKITHWIIVQNISCKKSHSQYIFIKLSWTRNLR